MIGAVAAAIGAVATSVVLGLSLLRDEKQANGERPAAAVGVESLFETGQIWRGSLVCSGYPADLVLEIDAADASRGTLRFDYGGGLGGSYEVALESGSPPRAEVRFTNWIEQPNGFLPVDLHGEVTNGREFVGTVVHPACKDFSLALVP